MEMLNITRYNNESPNAVPNAEYYADEHGRDWYENQSLFTKKWIVATDSKDNVLCVTQDVSGLRPVGMNVFDCDEVPEGIGLGYGWKFTNGKFIKDKELEIANNTKIRKDLMREASDEIAALEFAATLGDTTDDEDDLLKAWQEYRLDVSRVNVKSIGVEWPKKPS
ncbi:tail fiber assembly protein [Serratia phage MyoSmar]|uniref:Tail fiber assembly protein n=2 Tax=Myosmarvirus TaxID=2843428 RepID=A0A5B9NFA0_9CAUD|nr:tail fiber assembly protein [Serratia phage MyoSmar]QEG09503.1 tail fiber assembly protein [Serratia phage MyoSmar]